jgi:hypothetical protein|tara:strand:+ start:250 stop:414 length:165 start_codon:yes stop_codon:yes gene_type:complete
MNTIDNRNCAGLCMEQYCGKVEMYYEIVSINGMNIFVALCEKHMDKWLEVKKNG